MRTQERFFNPQFAEAEHAPHTEQRLQAGVEYVVDTETPLMHDERYGDIVATIATGDKYSASKGAADSFVLIDVRNNPRYRRGNYSLTEFGDLALNGDIQFVLVGENFTEPGKAGFKGLRRGESFTLGRENGVATNRFDLKAQTSRNHFEIECTPDGQVVVVDLSSSNGTYITRGIPGAEAHSEHQAHAGNQEQEQPREQPQQERPQQSDRPQQQEFKLNPLMEKRLQELNKQFSSEIEDGLINDAMIIGVLREVATLRSAGIEDGKILKQIARRIHPDKFPAGTPEHDRMNALFKVVNKVVGK